MRSIEEELKPCPFCGSKAILSETEGGESTVSCTMCEAYFIDDMLWGQAGYDQVANVIAKWNRRVETETGVVPPNNQSVKCKMYEKCNNSKKGCFCENTPKCFRG